MRVMKVVCVFVLSCVIFSVPVLGVEIAPSGVVIPSSPGETFSFDYVISDPMGFMAIGVQNCCNC